MTTHEFLKRWNRPSEKSWLAVEAFTIRLEPHLSTDPTGEFVFAIECTICTGDFPRIHESARSNAIKGRTVDAVLEDLLEELDATLSQRVNSRSPHHPGSGKPVLAVVAGAGFSAGFGFPVTVGLRDLVTQSCSSPRSRLDELFPNARQEYPLNEYLAEEGKFSDFEVLLSIWEAYRHQLGQVDHMREVRHGLCYRRFIEHICCRLYKLSWDVKKNPEYGGRFDELAAWLRAAKDRYDVRFITFNNDVILEMLCNRAGFSFTYQESPDPQAIPIRKLHGSVNWLEYSEKMTSPNGTIDLIHKSQGQYIYAFPEVDRCPYGSSGRMPVLIPPSAGKTYRGIYEWIWTFAARDIMTAEKVLLVGYSFPPLDVFAEHHLVRCLKDAGKPITYILPDAPSQKRLHGLLRETSPTCIPEEWQVDHFRSQTATGVG